MSLITCPDCRKEISDQATSCPHCGRPLNTSQSVKVEDTDARGFLGKPGTFSHAMNVGCLTIIIGLAVLILFFLVKR
jgi:predicted amidophosphoribosyltransferase